MRGICKKVLFLEQLKNMSINGILGEQLNVNIVICVVLGLEFHLSTYYVSMEHE